MTYFRFLAVVVAAYATAAIVRALRHCGRTR
jgi:hypothetical protein